jgi:3-hydroxy acid dehydrogenase/malonic semialdehyde reductase
VEEAHRSSLVQACRGDAKAAAVYKDTLTPALSAADVADAVAYVAGLPRHVNVNSIQLMPVCQAFGPLAVKRV